MTSTLYETTPGQARAVPAGFSLTDLLLVCMALLWGVNFIVVKYATRIVAPLAFNSTRILLAVLVLWAIVLVRGLELPKRRDFLTLLALGSMGNGLYQILFVLGIARTRASDAALLVAASPAFIEIVGAVRGHERMAPRGVAGMALSLAGISLVVTAAAQGTAGTSTMLGNAFVLSSCLCWAVFSVLLKPYTERIDGVTLSAITMTGGVIPSVAVAIPSLLATQWAAMTAAAWGAVVYAGIGSLVIAYLFWYRGVKVLGPTRTSMYSNLQPIVAMTAAWALLGETPHARQLTGALCIICGLLLTRIPARAAVVAHE